jgi:hypothetical protein
MAEPAKVGRPSNDDKARAILTEIKKRHNDGLAEDSDNFDLALEDIRFIYDEDGQWEDDAKQKRKGRPCYTYNRVIGAVNQVIGDQRQNKPSIKVRGVDSKADPKTAEVFTGLIRNIENSSDAETAYDTAFKFAVAGGRGLWRVMPEYESDDGFDQCIYIKRVSNPFTAFCDPAAKDFCKRDAGWWIVSEKVSKDAFGQLYPDAEQKPIELGEYDSQWFLGDEMRVAEYWRRKPKLKTIALLSDGRTVDYTSDIKAVEDELAALGVTVTKKRQVRGHVIEWFKVSGCEILEGPIEYNWKYIPIVPVYGRTINIEGEEKWQGIVRHSKDAQRSYNYHRSTIVETVALQPKAPYMVTPKMVKDHEDMWRQANVKNYPYMLYNADPDSPTLKPAREPPPPVPAALIQLTMQDVDDIKTATGFFDPSLGQRSNETSGRAIMARQREGDVGSYEFIDNLAKAIKFTGEILVDMIPQIYDTARQIRILGADGKEDFVAINQEVKDEQTGETKLVHDLSQGKYDVAVTVGPSYTTQRQESAETLIALSGSSQIVAEAAPDLIAKNLDVPGAEELEKRLRGILIKKGIVQPTEDDKDLIQPPSETEQKMEALQMRLAELEAGLKEAQIAKEQATAKETEIDTIVKTATFISTPPQPAEAKTSVGVN